MIHRLSFSPTPVPLHFVLLRLCKLYFHAPWPTVFPWGFPYWWYLWAIPKQYEAFTEVNTTYWWYLWAIPKHNRDRRLFLLIQNEAADGSCWSSSRTGTIGLQQPGKAQGFLRGFNSGRENTSWVKPMPSVSTHLQQQDQVHGHHPRQVGSSDFRNHHCLLFAPLTPPCHPCLSLSPRSLFLELQPF